jgi:hypothetical protein
MGSRDDAGWERYRSVSADSGCETLNRTSKLGCESSGKKDNDGDRA